MRLLCVYPELTLIYDITSPTLSKNTVTTHNNSLPYRAVWRPYYELCKPRVVALMLITTVVGMLLATPYAVPWQILIFGNIGIGLTACAGAVINHLADRHIDILMHRTEGRPIPQGKVSPHAALIFALSLAIIGLGTLLVVTNLLTTILTFFSLVGYALIYTLFLKHATSQNIVIGGLAGAAPPLLGWTAVTGHLDAGGLLLLLIIFVWTPPHFWALAIHRVKDYEKAKVPMLPVTHGIAYTKLNVLLYTCLLTAVTMMPFVIGMSSWIYLIGALLLNAGFLYWAIRLKFGNDPKVPMKTFWYSITYLMLLFVVLLFDHYFMIL
ncbi:MAG: cyoE [Gammaproteobacteria bacterium]|jgi:protoheme IX farnesyltransferase|nr:cyoE [Gammaproteobacteria bacterium]